MVGILSLIAWIRKDVSSCLREVIMEVHFRVFHAKKHIWDQGYWWGGEVTSLPFLFYGQVIFNRAFYRSHLPCSAVDLQKLLVRGYWLVNKCLSLHWKHFQPFVHPAQTYFLIQMVSNSMAWALRLIHPNQNLCCPTLMDWRDAAGLFWASLELRNPVTLTAPWGRWISGSHIVLFPH